MNSNIHKPQKIIGRGTTSPHHLGIDLEKISFIKRGAHARGRFGAELYQGIVSRRGVAKYFFMCALDFY